MHCEDIERRPAVWYDVICTESDVTNSHIVPRGGTEESRTWVVTPWPPIKLISHDLDKKKKLEIHFLPPPGPPLVGLYWRNLFFILPFCIPSLGLQTALTWPLAQHWVKFLQFLFLSGLCVWFLQPFRVLFIFRGSDFELLVSNGPGDWKRITFSFVRYGQLLSLPSLFLLPIFSPILVGINKRTKNKWCHSLIEAVVLFFSCGNSRHIFSPWLSLSVTHHQLSVIVSTLDIILYMAQKDSFEILFQRRLLEIKISLASSHFQIFLLYATDILRKARTYLRDSTWFFGRVSKAEKWLSLGIVKSIREYVKMGKCLIRLFDSGTGRKKKRTCYSNFRWQTRISRFVENCGIY